MDTTPTLAGLDADFVVRWIDVLDGLVTRDEATLTELDAAIGDADHGANMTRGLHAARADLAGDPPRTVEGACRQVGLALVTSIGGASGPLYGTVFMSLADALPATPTVDGAELVAGLRESLRGVQRLGAAVVGDKTMIDAIAPAVAALEELVAHGVALPKALADAARAADEGALGTVPMRARKGRASYLGARSEGHQDPGATSTALLFHALATAVAG